MTKTQDLNFWQRFSKATGATGAVAFVLVYVAASLNQRFDWSVFGLAGAALFLCWSRTWVLVPIHLRNKKAEEESWNRYFESDWRFVSSLSGLSGAELDQLRALFRAGDDSRVRGKILEHWPGMDGEDVQGFMRFFNDEFMDTVSAYIDESGRLQPFD